MTDGNDGGARRAPYADYQLSIYRAKLLEGRAPPTTTDPRGLEAQAQAAMTAEAFGYVAGGAGTEETVAANRAALAAWRVMPRFLGAGPGPAGRDLSVALFGTRLASPVVAAPVGVQGEYHADGERGTAAACAELAVPFCISTASSASIEDVAAAAAGGPAPWFQLYRPRDDDITASLLGRARRAGCRVLVVTLDTYTMSWRPRDLDHGYLPFAVGRGNAVGFSDPVFRRKFAEQMRGDDGDGDGAGPTPEERPLEASQAWLSEVFSGRGHQWRDLARLRELWGADNAIVLKGILSVEDARLALEHGMDGIVVSNHGGRQLDGAVASLDVLPEIVDAVGAHMTVLFDSGIRSGVDVMRALCLGAKAVLVGRPIIYGLGIAGKEGAKHVLASILADLDQSMGLAGVNTIADLTRDRLRRAPPGSVFKVSL